VKNKDGEEVEYMRFELIERRIAKGERLIIHCAASWNSYYDKKISTALSQIPVSVHDAEVVLLDTDEESSWPALRRWSVRNLPALVLFAGETHLGTIIGCRPAPDLTTLLADFFNTTTQSN
jgi:hypothetical protein